ncbi:TPA: hypothetical protein DCE37_05940 [Candidatus Latescibacteria bacterium]|mgnify:FL=1|nr:hypothetical protein [Candidatus Latescibacterota bacterium]
MNIICVYSVDTYTTAPWTMSNDPTVEKPLFSPTEIPFGLSAISSVLNAEGHDVQLVVVNPSTPLEELFRDQIEKHKPGLVALTAVSSQFPKIKEVTDVVKGIDPELFVFLGGSHATLAPDDAIAHETVDAICIGEGDHAVLEVARQLGDQGWVSGVPNVWVKHPKALESRTTGARQATEVTAISDLPHPDCQTGTTVEDKGAFELERNPNGPFIEDLDSLPHVDREMWEPWIANPNEEVSIIVGRGCPFKCTYCANHALAKISDGTFVRFRSPEDIISEIDSVSCQYPEVDRMYLEVETMGADITLAHDLFAKLAIYNTSRENPLRYWMNLAVHSSFMKNEEKVRAFFTACAKANVSSLNIGLESGSERVRKEILRRPRYSNKEIIEFSRIAREHGVGITLYVLMGLPGETHADYKDTVRVAREMKPDNVFLSIFAPYPGTDLYETSVEMGLIPDDGPDVISERFKATLDLPGFSRRRVRFENVLFWFKVFRGNWSFPRIVAHTVKAFIRPYRPIWAFYTYLSRTSAFVGRLKRWYRVKVAGISPSYVEPTKVNQI